MRHALALPLVLVLGWMLGRLDAGPGPAVASGPADFRAAVQAAEASVVHVATQVPGRSRDEAVGSGWVLEADGWIVSSAHVLAGARRVLVGVAGRAPVLAEVVASDPRVDVALLKAPLTGLVPLAAGSSRELAPGMWVLACGSPYGLERSWSAGIVSGLHRRGVAAQPSTYEDFIQADAAANLGNSGGPLLDPNGRVVGMVTQILTRAGGFQGISLATPVEAVLEAVRRLRGGGTAPARPSLGLSVRERPGGLEVASVEAGGPAAAAGVVPGEVLLEVAGQRVASAADVERALWGRRAGEAVDLVVQAGAPGAQPRAVLKKTAVLR